MVQQRSLLEYGCHFTKAQDKLSPCCSTTTKKGGSQECSLHSLTHNAAPPHTAIRQLVRATPAVPKGLLTRPPSCSHGPPSWLSSYLPECPPLASRLLSTSHAYLPMPLAPHPLQASFPLRALGGGHFTYPHSCESASRSRGHPGPLLADLTRKWSSRRGDAQEGRHGVGLQVVGGRWQ